MDVVSAAGDKLWKELVGPLDSTKPLSTKITNVSLSFHGVEAGEMNQQGIEGFLSKTPSSPSKRKRRAGDDKEEVGETVSHGESELTPNVGYFICDRCKKRIALPRELVATSELDEETREEALGSLRAEHQDFHFAQDLSRMGSDEERPERRDSNPTAKKKRRRKGERTEGEGIARFFNKR